MNEEEEKDKIQKKECQEVRLEEEEENNEAKIKKDK